MRVFLVAPCLAAALAAPVAAECLTTANLDGRGIEFHMADGRVWRARDADEKGIRLDQVNEDLDDETFIEGPYGVYEVRTGHVVPGGDGRWGYIDRTFRKAPAEPVPGESWASKVEEDQGNFYGPGSGLELRAEALYRFLPAKDVMLGGCSYRIIPVEATSTGKDAISGMPVLGRADRWIYFPALGVGVRTMHRDAYRKENWKAGITDVAAVVE